MKTLPVSFLSLKVSSIVANIVHDFVQKLSTRYVSIVSHCILPLICSTLHSSLHHVLQRQLILPLVDCAVLEMTNYTQTALPESFGGLKSLVKLGVYTGELKQLPQLIGDNHKRLLVLMVIGNKLESLPESVGNLKNLLQLYVFNFGRSCRSIFK